jgi:hypothetical protein
MVQEAPIPLGRIDISHRHFWDAYVVLAGCKDTLHRHFISVSVVHLPSCRGQIHFITYN